MDIQMLTVVRALHILLAALWLGAGMLLTAFLMPAMRQVGLGGAPLMNQLAQRRVGQYMGAVAGLTALTGLWLYWRVSNGFDMNAMLSAPVVVLDIGVLAGLLAVVLGGAVLGRSMNGMGTAIAEASRLSEGEERDRHLRQLAALQRRFALFSKIVAALMVIALVCMTLSHVL